MKLSVVIPAHNEADCIESTIRQLVQVLQNEKIEHEILVVNDGSIDATEEKLQTLQQTFESVRYLNRPAPHGFGLAIRWGLENFTGDAVAIFMADASDSAADLVRFFRTLEKDEVDCVFGSRFMRESRVMDYPWLKLILNRFANLVIQLLFSLRYNDVTNAFKLYRRHVIQGLKPFLSHHFNLTIELPLKAIVRGYSYQVVSNDWTNRKTGESKLKIKEMGSRYLFIMLYCFIEKWLSRGDYQKKEPVHKI